MSSPFREQRERLLQSLAESASAGVYFSGKEKVRNADSTHRFRPDSDFYYLTGCREPEACLVLLPKGEERALLFLRPKDREQEIWTGRRVGVEAAPEVFGVDRAHPIEELGERLPKLLAGHRAIEYALGVDAERDALLSLAASRATRFARAAGQSPETWHHPRVHLHEQRLRKSAAELALMRRAAEVSGEAHRAAMAEAAPGRNETELDALLEYTFRKSGGTGAAYTNIVAGGENACILHYNENNRALVDGELCLIDAGCEWGFYASDVTRTFPVNGTFSPPQRALYEVVLAAQEAAIRAARPGVNIESLHELAVRRLTEGLVELGLLQGSVDAAVEKGDYRAFYMHKTGHWLGLDVHDAGAYTRAGVARPLEPGMVFTVEPGLYVATDAAVEPRWRGIGIRIEDDVLVTRDGVEVLTRSTPKSVADVEAACQESVALA